MFRYLDNILPQLQTFHIGTIQFHTYGLILGIAIAVLIMIASNKLPGKFVQSNHFTYMYLFCAISAVIGARLSFVIVNWNLYKNNLSQILQTQQGGLHLFGAIFFGTTSIAIYWNLFIRKNFKKLTFLQLTDAIAHATPVAQAIGRFANYINQELFGLPSNLPWSIFIPLEKRPQQYATEEFFHPTFLYESILSLISFTILLQIFNRVYKSDSIEETKLQPTTKTKKGSTFKFGQGFVTGLYLINYGVIRILVERFRIDAEPIWEFIKLADIASFVLIYFGILIILYNKSNVSKPKTKDR